MIKEKIDVEITGRMKERAVVAKQYDNLTREVAVALYDKGKPYTIDDGADITLNALKPDGCRVYNTCQKTGTNEVTVVLTSQLLACAGSVPCDIRISKGEKTLSSARFELIVEKSPYGEDSVVSESEMTELQALRNRLDEAAENAKKSAGEAEKHEEGASKSEENAKAHASSANNAKTAAEKAEANAQASEKDAKASASKAETMRDETKAFRDTAAGYAGAASYSFVTDDDGYICLNYKED